MFDFLRRALSHPRDYWRVFCWRRLTLVRQEKHGEGIYSFIFKKPEGLTWKAGQHGVWWFFDFALSGKNWRAFSIASSVHENEIRISTNIPAEPSAFKQKLLALKAGDSIWLQGPFGEFHVHHYHQSIGIAGGIGITPFRAIAYELAMGHCTERSLQLIYSARNEYTFKAELDAWMASSPQFHVTYIHTPEEVQTALQQAITERGKVTPVLLSGSPGMITALTKSCHDQGVTKVVSDPFKGY